MLISEYLTDKKEISHKKIDFVNTRTERDTKLFIDPVLIELGETEFCEKAKEVVYDYFNHFFIKYHNGESKQNKLELLKCGREVNYTHLGYAKRNGKGNTKEGLYTIFEGVEEYIDRYKLSRSLDLPLFITGFAEDGMSDLLTNILFKELSDFTSKQCKHFNVEMQSKSLNHCYWDIESHLWKEYNGNYLLIEEKPFLFVPKEIVQKHYIYTSDSFLRSVIAEHICEERAIIDKKGKKIRPNKTDVKKELIEKYGDAHKVVKHFVNEDKELLNEYHRIVDKKYETRCLSDDELDKIVYGRFI